MITKTNLGAFDSISKFNEEYLLIGRDDLYNLIDFNGEYLSKDWFESINKDGNGEIIVSEKSRACSPIRFSSTSQMRSYASVCSMVRDSSIVRNIPSSCITILAVPSRIMVNKSVKAIGKVTIFGQEFYLGDNGKLYDIETLTIRKTTDFLVTADDMVKLTNETRKLNKMLVADGSKQPFVWFSFSEKGMVFLSLNDKPTIPSYGAWGGKTIKFRFKPSCICDDEKAKVMIKAIKDLPYWDKYGNNPNLEERTYWTLLFKPNEIDKIYDTINRLSALLSAKK